MVAVRSLVKPIPSRTIKTAVPERASVVPSKEKGTTAPPPPIRASGVSAKALSVEEKAAPAAACRTQAALDAMGMRVRAVMDAHADTLSVAELEMPLSAAEADAVREALWDLQQELAGAMGGFLQDRSLQREHATLLAQVREASPHGDIRSAPVARVSVRQLGSLQAMVARYVAAAEKFSRLPTAAPTFAMLLDRAGVRPMQSFDTVDPELAHRLVNEVLATPTTLANKATRIGLLRVLVRVLENGPVPISELDTQVRHLSHSALLRRDGYFVNLATGGAMAFAGPPKLHPNIDGLVCGGRFSVGNVYSLVSGDVRSEENNAHLGYFEPVDSRILVRVIAGIGRSIDDAVRGIPLLLMHPVETLGPILPALASALAHAPEQLEMFRALPDGDKAEALAHFASQAALLMLGLRGGAAAQTTLLTGLRFTESGALALTMARTTAVAATQELALALLTSEMGAPRTPAAPRVKPPQPAEIRMQHILEGEVKNGWDRVNQRYARRASGFHLESATGKARVVEGTRTATDAHGVYRAKVEIYDAESGQWVTKAERSTFYPRHYTAADVELAIREAYAEATPGQPGEWFGMSRKGLRIRMFIDSNGVVRSAFPVQVL